jgi:hypothetical protein
MHPKEISCDDGMKQNIKESAELNCYYGISQGIKDGRDWL